MKIGDRVRVNKNYVKINNYNEYEGENTVGKIGSIVNIRDGAASLYPFEVRMDDYNAIYIFKEEELDIVE